MDLSDVRKNIDRVDGEIRRLFVERMTLADQVACIKAKTEDKIYKPDREEVIIKKQTEGMKPELVREYTALIKRIMEVSRKYQYGRTLELRQCFPFEYTKVPAVILKPAMVREELYTCEDYSKDKVITVASYEEVADYIKEGKADAGIGIIEEVGIGVSDTLVVLPSHNRVKIMFECPNHSGSISSILSMISDYGVNLTEIHSRPFWKDNSWNYKFFAELNANIDTKEIRALLYQLSQETEYLKILGSYACEGDF